MRSVVATLVAVLVTAVLLPATPSSAVPDEAPAARSAAGTKVVYPGRGVQVWRASGQLGRLDDTSPAFRRAVRRHLQELWVALDRDPDCAQAPFVQVKEYRPRVAFISNAGTFSGGPGDAPEKCAGGGAYHFYVKRDGKWRHPFRLGGQDVMRCHTLRKWGIPRMSGAKVCWDGEDVVRYVP